MSLQYQSTSILCETKAVDLKLDWLLFIFTLRVKVAQLCPSLCDPMNYSPPGSSVHGIHHARILEWVAILFSKGSLQLWHGTQVSYIAGGFFTSWATKEAQEYTGVGSLFLLQGIFPTQELNQSLLHCRWILYQLSYLTLIKFIYFKTNSFLLKYSWFTVH